jgi:hypothetical protein
MITVNGFKKTYSDKNNLLLDRVERQLESFSKKYNNEKEMFVILDGIDNSFVEVVKEHYKDAGFVDIKFKSERIERDESQVYNQTGIVFVIY